VVAGVNDGDILSGETFVQATAGAALGGKFRIDDDDGLGLDGQNQIMAERFAPGRQAGDDDVGVQFLSGSEYEEVVLAGAV